MVVSTFFVFRVSELSVPVRPQNTEFYAEVMKDYLLPYVDKKLPVSWTFQK